MLELIKKIYTVNVFMHDYVCDFQELIVVAYEYTIIGGTCTGAAI